MFTKSMYDDMNSYCMGDVAKSMEALAKVQPMPPDILQPFFVPPSGVGLVANPPITSTRFANPNPSFMKPYDPTVLVSDVQLKPNTMGNDSVVSSTPKSKNIFKSKLLDMKMFSADAECAPDPDYDRYDEERMVYLKKRAKLIGKSLIDELDNQWHLYIETNFPQYQQQDDVEQGPILYATENDKYVEMSACSHERELFALEDRNNVVTLLMERLYPHIDKFDAVAISGYSMAMIAPIIADRLQKNLVLVRKDSEVRVSGYDVEGIHNQRCVFIDDLISGGVTFDRVYKGVQEIGCDIVGYTLYTKTSPSPFIMNTYKDIEYWGD